MINLLLRRIHRTLVFNRRIDRLAELLARHLPDHAHVLDVGCGSGELAVLLAGQKVGVEICGLDVMVRPQTRIPVQCFDGMVIPYADDSVDYVMLVDVLHHARHPEALLAEAKRVARRGILVKDHLCENGIDAATLRIMDWLGNAPHDVAMTWRYFPIAAWETIFGALALRVQKWESRLALYSPLIDWLFGRQLHFVALLVKS